MFFIVFFTMKTPYFIILILKSRLLGPTHLEHEKIQYYKIGLLSQESPLESLKYGESN